MRAAFTVLFCCLLATAPLAGAAPPEPVTGAAEPASAAAETNAELRALDPWERYNRRMYAFNRGLDRLVFLPVARGYQRFTPSLLRRGVSNFFDNLQEPVVMLNLLLQGRPKLAAASLGRFALNSTLGIGGIFDPASEAKLPNSAADFGQTFARWGWRESRYLMLPVFGPATVRDTLGKGASSTVSPVDWLARREGSEVSFLYGINARAGALSAESFLAGAADEYALVRDGYLQYRRCQIVDCSEELPDYLLPDYEFEIPDMDLGGDTLRR